MVDEDEAGQPLRPACYNGPPGTAGVGICRAGTQACVGGSPAGDCTGQQLPELEVCDGLDNDCNGAVDDVAWPPLAADYSFGSTSYVHSLHMNDPRREEPCCHDFDGDGVQDNRLGEILGQLAPTGLDVNREIDGAIRSGALTLLLEWRCLDDPTNDPGLEVPVFFGQDTDGSFEDNLVGNEHFRVHRPSFVMQQVGYTGTPLVFFPSGSVAAGQLEAGPTRFPVSFLFLAGAGSDLYVEEAWLGGRIVETAFGLGLADGWLRGGVRLDAILERFNGYYAESCACLGADGPMIRWTIENGGYAIQCQDVSRTNHCALGSQCWTLGALCSVLGGLFNRPDLDLDGDGVADALSIGLQLEATSAFIDGLVP